MAQAMTVYVIFEHTGWKSEFIFSVPMLNTQSPGAELPPAAQVRHYKHLSLSYVEKATMQSAYVPVKRHRT